MFENLFTPWKEKLFEELAEPDTRLAWELFGKHIVKTILPGKNACALPDLSPADCPCSPGIVAIPLDIKFKDIFKGRRVVLAGNLWDFCPRKFQRWKVPICSKTSLIDPEFEYRHIVMSKDRSKSVLFECRGLEEQLFTGDYHFNKSRVYVDLDNYSDTGLDSSSMFLVTKTFNLHRIRITAMVDRKSDTAEMTCITPIACYFTRLSQDSETNLVDLSMKDEAMHKPGYKVRIRPRNSYQAILNHLMPNQRRFPPVSISIQRCRSCYDVSNGASNGIIRYILAGTTPG